jgi:hypothetical protein
MTVKTLSISLYRVTNRAKSFSISPVSSPDSCVIRDGDNIAHTGQALFEREKALFPL